jgi:hypothetical protein
MRKGIVTYYIQAIAERQDRPTLHTIDGTNGCQRVFILGCVFDRTSYRAVPAQNRSIRNCSGFCANHLPSFAPCHKIWKWVCFNFAGQGRGPAERR